MDDSSDLDLLVWALATFHAAVLVLALVLIVYRAGSLAGALHNVGTLPGVALFAALWIATCWTTGRAVRSSDWMPEMAPPVGSLLQRGAGWGGINGIIFFLCLDTTIALSALAAGRLPNVATSIAFFLGTSVVGSIPAFLVGGAVGMIFASVDIVVLEVVRRISITHGADAGPPPDE